MPSVLINIDVPDLDAAAKFYMTAFELHEGRRLGPDVRELLGAEAPIYLLHKPSADSWTPRAGVDAKRRSRDYGRHWTPLHLDFVVTDLDAAIQRALAAGAVLEASVSENSWGRLALLADPFGHGLCLLQFLGRGYDELRQSP